MLIDKAIKGTPLGYRVVIITLDSHAAGPCDRAAERLANDFPGLSVEVMQQQSGEKTRVLWLELRNP